METIAMPLAATTILRRTLLLGWVVAFGLVVALVVSSRIAPTLGFEPVIIRSGSMAPHLPVGSLVFVRTGVGDAVKAGDVVTLRLRHGQLVTHRVVRTAQLPDGLYLETKGDANEAVDPVLVPIDAVVGVAAHVVPVAGYALAYLSLPTGMASVSSFLATLLLAAWLFEDPRPVPVRRTDPRPASRQVRPGPAPQRD